MTIDIRTDGARATLILKGELILDGRTEDLREEIEHLLQQGFSEFLLDLEGLSYVDTAGLGELVHVYVTVRKRGGTLRLLNLTKRIRDLLAVTKHLATFDNDDSSNLPDPVDSQLPWPGASPALWFAMWVAVAILAMVIARLAAPNGL